MAYHQSQNPALDTNAFIGQNVDDVMDQLQNQGKLLDTIRWWSMDVNYLPFLQGYTATKYNVSRLTQGRPLSPVSDEKVVHLYVNDDDTVQQIITKR